MRKIFYKIFLYFCLAAYLPLALIYAFNFFYVDKYIVEEKRSALIQVAENIYITELKKIIDDEIFSFFILDIGNEEKIKRRRLEFVAGTGYTLENIEKTDYIFCPSALLFSKRFVEKIGNLLREEMKFFSCRLVCQDVSLEWYAAKIILRIPIIDKEASTYRTLSDGERVLKFIKFRRDIEEEFFIAKDKESTTDFVVSELFVDICKRNGLLIDFKEV